MESWLEKRQAHAERLRQRAAETRSTADAMAWERYTVQTVRMQSTAEELRGALGDGYQMEHGLSLSYKGSDIYLEHLVVGPTGVYLVESPDQDDEAWRRDFNRNIAFLRELLGVNRRFLSCLVIPRGPITLTPSEGVNLVDSVDLAIEVIRQGGLEEISPTVAREVLMAVQALVLDRPEPPATPKRSLPFRLPQLDRSAYWERWGRLEWAALALAFAMNLLVLASGDSAPTYYYILAFIFGTIIIVSPVAVVVGLVLLIPYPTLRRGLVWAIVAVEALVLSVALVGMLLM